MAWRRGVRRHSVDAVRFVQCLLNEYTYPELASLCGVSVKTVWRWKTGVDWPSPDILHRMIDSLFPQSSGSGPVYNASMAIDGNTRVGGVGEFTIRAAQGDIDYVSSVEDVE